MANPDVFPDCACCGDNHDACCITRIMPAIVYGLFELSGCVEGVSIPLRFFLTSASPCQWHYESDTYVCPNDAGTRFRWFLEVNCSGPDSDPPTGLGGPLVQWGMFIDDNILGAGGYSFDNATVEPIFAGDTDASGHDSSHGPIEWSGNCMCPGPPTDHFCLCTTGHLSFSE